MSHPAGPIEGKVGPSVANTEAKIVDLETGEDVGASSPGELLVRGPQVMQGYDNDRRRPRPRSTKMAGCTPATSPASTTRGTSSIVDRVKELIKYKGYQVARPSSRPAACASGGR